MMRWLLASCLLIAAWLGHWLLAVPGGERPATSTSTASDATLNRRVDLEPPATTGSSAGAALVPQSAVAATLHPTPPHTATRVGGEPVRKPLAKGDGLGIAYYLLVGLDRRADGHGPALADTILVLAVDDERGRAGVVSIPRDLYVEIPGRGPDRINTVFTQARRSKVDPLQLLTEVVTATFGWSIEHALAIDLAVFERAVDAVGGVSIVAPCPVRDRFIDARAPGGHVELEIVAGPQRLDGRTAAMYVRSRRGGADWTRARRQQAVLLALRDRLTDGNLTRLPALWSQFESAVTTNMRRIELLALAQTLLTLEPGNLHGVVLGWREMEGFTTPEGKRVLVPRDAELQRALDGLLDAPAPGSMGKDAACPRMPKTTRDAG